MSQLNHKQVNKKIQKLSKKLKSLDTQESDALKAFQAAKFFLELTQQTIDQERIMARAELSGFREVLKNLGPGPEEKPSLLEKIKLARKASEKIKEFSKNLEKTELCQ